MMIVRRRFRDWRVVKSIEKIAREARSSTSTVANGLHQLKTKVNTLSRNHGGGGGGG